MIRSRLLKTFLKSRRLEAGNIYVSRYQDEISRVVMSRCIAGLAIAKPLGKRTICENI
jgi:hypothetical protein